MSTTQHGQKKLHVEEGESKSLSATPMGAYFRAAVKLSSSDLIARGGEAPKLRLRGSLRKLDTPVPTVTDFNQWIKSGLSEHHWNEVMEYGSCDVAQDFEVEGVKHRFRINVFLTRGRCALAARRVNNDILDFKDLYLPESMAKICEVTQGLVLLAGVTGSGKSTTIASMLQRINEERACHILTIEDPIEYLFEDAKSTINQREVGIDVPAFATALRAMVRENPDVVLIGEMRDRETFEAALQAAETGHLVFGTIHASSATQAFARIYDLFPQEEREAVRSLLAYQIQAVVYQKLLPSLDHLAEKGVHRVPAVEVLLQSPPTRRYILDGREGELEKVIHDSRESGMQSYVDSLVDLVNNDYIHQRVAVANAPSPEEIKMRLRGINTR